MKNLAQHITESFKDDEAVNSIYWSISKNSNSGCTEKELIDMGRSDNINKSEIQSAIKRQVANNRIYKKNDGTYHLNAKLDPMTPSKKK